MKDTNRIFNYSENPHIFYRKETQDYDPGASDLWSEALGNVWDKIWDAPNILGSFIWEWQNQGIADQNSDKTSEYWYGLNQLRQENNKGIVDAYRNLKPEWWIVKQVYSPVQVGVKTIAATNGTFSIPITNRYSFTDLNELTTRWTAYNGSKALQSGSQHISCPPLQSVLASFPAPSGTTVLRIDFDHPDGTSVIAANLAVDGSPQPAPPSAHAAGSTLTVSDATSTLIVSNGLEKVVFNKMDGTITEWSINGKDVLVGGPIINLGELKASNDKKYYEAKRPPITSNAAVTASPPNANGVVTVSVKSDVASGDTGAPLGKFNATYAVQPDAEIGVSWSIAWTAPDFSLWEEGLKFSTPSQLSKMTWLRDSYFTDYPAGHIGEPYGSAQSTDVSFRASKRSLHWLTLTDRSGDGLALLSSSDGTPLIGRANTSATMTTLFASTQVSGPSDYSAAWVGDHDIHVGTGKPLGGSFVLRAVGP